jgi:hypothetical protein
MRSFAFAAATFVAFAVAPISAHAVEQTEGMVASVNSMSGTLTLQSGQSFTFAKPQVLLGILPGQKVGVTYVGTEGIGVFNPQPAQTHMMD